MYERDISRRDPGCVVFLLDRSDSMKQTWGNSRETMAEGAARALNETLLELLFTSQGEPGKARHYFDVGIFGYGLRPGAGGEGAEPGVGGQLAGQGPSLFCRGHLRLRFAPGGRGRGGGAGVRRQARGRAAGRAARSAGQP